MIEETNKVLQASRQTKAKPDASSFFASTLQWVKKAELEEPLYSANSRRRDQWLRAFAKQEPHLAGVLSTAVSLDANRGYSLVGGRNQVARFARVLQNVENGLGWRTHKSLGSQDYYSTDMNQIIEIETNGKNGPLSSLYHVDSTRCQLTNDPKFPLEYTNIDGDTHNWKPEWFYRVASMPNPDINFNKLGFCAVSRCLKIAQIMVAVVEHDIEKLSKLAPKGLLTVESDDITQESWNLAFDEHKQVYSAKTGNQYFDEMVVLVARAIKPNITAFSELPDRFDPFKFTDYMMKAYALNFNLPTRYFWDVGGSSFGDGGETSMQAERATQTGLANYLLADQEQLQQLLPDSLLFQYEEDDTQSKIQKAELLTIWADAGLKLVDLGMSTDAVLAMMVKEGLIDPQFVPETEEVVVTDEEGVSNLQYRRQELIEKYEVQMAVKKYPSEPIVEYQWPNNNYRLLWNEGQDAIKKYYQINSQFIHTKGSRQKRKIIQQKDKMKDIVELGIEGEIDKDETKERLVTYQLAEMVVKYFENATTKENRTTLEQDTYNSAVAYSENPALLDGEPILENEQANEEKSGFELAVLALLLPDNAYNRIEEVNQFSNSSDLFQQVEDGYFEDHDLDYRIGLWDNAVRTFSIVGSMYLRGREDDLMIWNRSLVDSCETCLAQDGTIKTRAEWQSSTILPGINTICNGNCQCTIDEI